MKAITGSDIDKLVDDVTMGTMSSYCSYKAEEILRYVKEIDTLTVSKLRPMSEAPVNFDEFLALKKDTLCFQIISSNDGTGKYWTDGKGDDYITNDEFIGWIPLPEYKPETSK